MKIYKIYIIYRIMSVLTVGEINVFINDIGLVAGVWTLHAITKTICVLLKKSDLNGCWIRALLVHGKL